MPLVLLAADALVAPAVGAPVVASGWGPVSVQPVVPPVVVPPVPRPVGLRVPAIGVTSPLAELGIDASGALVPPERFDVAGWFAAGPAPGGPGPALLAGHVDSRAGPGVFHRLGSLRPGDLVLVSRADGSELRYVVSRTYSVAKTAFPTDLVYAPAPRSELRLVTCGGSFDPSVRSYRDNVIVEALLE
ncbi:hypothetical protein Lesp02_40790 [Lentzea sp. NBRC 105346]|nr:hypothetical protein Lesp02_40790 [Lentzea sp. NBRC 105346]